MRPKHPIRHSSYTRRSVLRYVHSTRHLVMGVLYVIVGMIEGGLRYTGNTHLFSIPFHYIFVFGSIGYGIFRIYRGCVLWRKGA